MTNTFTSPQFLKALAFAADKHKSQRRKGEEGIPYINHCIEVALLLNQVGKVEDEELLIAALLHDTIEDTNTKAEEIEQAFGERVRDIVLEVSDDKSLPKAVRKQLQIEKAAQKSPEARTLKLADKICNIRDIILHPPKNWPTERKLDYLAWAAKVIDQIRGAHPALEALFDEWLEKGKAYFQANS